METFYTIMLITLVTGTNSPVVVETYNYSSFERAIKEFEYFVTKHDCIVDEFEEDGSSLWGIAVGKWRITGEPLTIQLQNGYVR